MRNAVIGAAAALTGKRDFDKAKQLIGEAGYKGDRIVVLDAVDQPVAHSQALVVADVLKKLGVNVDLQAVDWGTLVTRRASKEPIEKGGLADVTAGSSCIVNAYTSNHDVIASKDTGAFHGFVLHAIDAVGLVHALLLRIQALLLPIKTLVLSGH